jgi:hypothetical protein
MQATADWGLQIFIGVRAQCGTGLSAVPDALMQPRMLEFALTLASLDGPDWETCAQVPWGDNLRSADLRTRDHELPGKDGRRMRLRVCEVYMGFGYSDVLLLVWHAASSPASAVRVKHTHTACPGSVVGSDEASAWVRTPVCGYHDDGPVARVVTSLRWTGAAPFVVVDP